MFKKNWYVIHVCINKEFFFFYSLLKRIKFFKMERYFSRILVPLNKFILKKFFFPGYILIEVNMCYKVWNLIKNTIKFISFLNIDKFFYFKTIKFNKINFIFKNVFKHLNL